MYVTPLLSLYEEKFPRIYTYSMVWSQMDYSSTSPPRPAPPFKSCLAMSYVIFLSIHLIYLSI